MLIEVEFTTDELAKFTWHCYHVPAVGDEVVLDGSVYLVRDRCWRFKPDGSKDVSLTVIKEGLNKARQK